MSEEPFYIGYLPKAPAPLGRFTRKVVVLTTLATLGVAAGLAVSLPYFGNGVFHFGESTQFAGIIRCGTAPRLSTDKADYLLVGAGKRGVPMEICGEADNAVMVQGSLIERDGRQLIEVAAITTSRAERAAEAAPVALGRFTLTGEIVDSKCYFGVMNPAEGQLHRACAVQCLRGDVPAVFIARDRSGARVELIVAGPDGGQINGDLLPWVGLGVEATGEVMRQGKWLVWRIEPKSIRRV
jgi:hypothetical protein